MADITMEALNILNQRVEAMHEDFTEMRKVLRELTGAINKLALVEERQAQYSQALERAFAIIAKVEARVDSAESRVKALEILAPENIRTRAWVDRAVLGIVGLVVLFIANATGLI